MDVTESDLDIAKLLSHNTTKRLLADNLVTNYLYGLNKSQDNLPISSNRDGKGYTFFVRPQLNLSKANLLNHRYFVSLLTEQTNSIQNYVRVMLDPRLPFNLHKQGAVDTALVDKYNPFIPVLSNTLVTMSGWPDLVVPTTVSPEGIRKEQRAQVDGAIDMFSVWEADITFRNTTGEPVNNIIDSWARYSTLAFEGIMIPYLDYITEDECDYDSRIFKIVTSEDGKYVKKIASTMGVFPLNIATGKFFETNKEGGLTGHENLTFKFKCHGVEYNDTILLKEFNDIMKQFNPLMADTDDNDNPKEMVKVPHELYNFTNYRMYPKINLGTLELEWWTKPSILNIKKI